MSSWPAHAIAEHHKATPIKAQYWPDHDTLDLQLADDPTTTESEVVQCADEQIILNFNADNRLVSFEFMRASQHAPSELIHLAQVVAENPEPATSS